MSRSIFPHLTSEAATGGVLLKKLFLKMLQNSQENPCARVSFLIKLQVCGFDTGDFDSGIGVSL